MRVSPVPGPVTMLALNHQFQELEEAALIYVMCAGAEDGLRTIDCDMKTWRLSWLCLDGRFYREGWRPVDRFTCRTVEATLSRWERMRAAALECKYFPGDC